MLQLQCLVSNLAKLFIRLLSRLGRGVDLLLELLASLAVDRTSLYLVIDRFKGVFLLAGIGARHTIVLPKNILLALVPSVGVSHGVAQGVAELRTIFISLLRRTDVFQYLMQLRALKSYLSIKHPPERGVVDTLEVYQLSFVFDDLKLTLEIIEVGCNTRCLLGGRRSLRLFSLLRRLLTLLTRGLSRQLRLQLAHLWSKVDPLLTRFPWEGVGQGDALGSPDVGVLLLHERRQAHCELVYLLCTKLVIGSKLSAQPRESGRILCFISSEHSLKSLARLGPALHDPDGVLNLSQLLRRSCSAKEQVRRSHHSE